MRIHEAWIRKMYNFWNFQCLNISSLICLVPFTNILDYKHKIFFFIDVDLISYQIFIFHQMRALQKLWKMFLFHLKSPFRSQDIQIFVFLSSPLFLPVSHCFRGCLKIKLKVFKVINWLNKNLMTHLEGIRYDIETLPIDRVLNKEHFYEKVMQKMWNNS